MRFSFALPFWGSRFGESPRYLHSLEADLSASVCTAFNAAGVLVRFLNGVVFSGWRATYPSTPMEYENDHLLASAKLTMPLSDKLEFIGHFFQGNQPYKHAKAATSSPRPRFLSATIEGAPEVRHSAPPQLPRIVQQLAEWSSRNARQARYIRLVMVNSEVRSDLRYAKTQIACKRIWRLSLCIVS